MRGHRNRFAILGVAVAAAGMWTSPAAAHVTANPNEASAGSFAFVEFRVGHGCDDSPTVEVVIQIPDEVVSVTPEVMDGWAIEVVREEPPAEAAAAEDAEGGHGGGEGRVTKGRVSEVRWTGNLPADRVDHFGLSMRFADEIDAPGVTFPTVQRCTEGELGWVEVPLDGEDPAAFFGEAESPAPYVLVTGEGGGDEDAADAVVDAVRDQRLDAGPAAAAGGVDGGNDALTIVALGAGLLGVLLGAGALVRAGAARQAAERS